MQKLMTICMWNADPERLFNRKNDFLTHFSDSHSNQSSDFESSWISHVTIAQIANTDCKVIAPQRHHAYPTGSLGQLIKTGRGIKNIMVFSKNDLVNDGDDDDTWWSYFCQDTLYSYPVKRAIMKLIMLIFDNDDDAGDDDDGEMQGQCTFWRYLTGSCNCNRYR